MKTEIISKRGQGRGGSLLLCKAFRLSLFVVACGLSACAGLDQTTGSSVVVSTDDGVGLVNGIAEPRGSGFLSGELGDLASRLDAAALRRLPVTQEISAAQAELSARKYDRLPVITPIASTSLRGDVSPSVGVGVEQLIWGGGRLTARLTDAELALTEAELNAWRDRNEEVFSGLEAIVQISRLNQRISTLGTLADKLREIELLLDARLEGGVSDRGESLRLRTARQELERRKASDISELRRARSDLRRYLPDAHEGLIALDLDQAGTECRRLWPEEETPNEALARVALERSEASEAVMRARRFPRLVLSADTRYSSGTWTDPTLGLRLDASDMLGMGRAANVNAAVAATAAARSSFELTKTEVQSYLTQLNSDFDGLRDEMNALSELRRETQASVELYREQLEAGSISITDGIALYREEADTELSLIDVSAELVLNCLNITKFRGLLVPLGSTDENQN